MSHLRPSTLSYLLGTAAIAVRVLVAPFDSSFSVIIGSRTMIDNGLIQAETLRTPPRRSREADSVKESCFCLTAALRSPSGRRQDRMGLQ